MIYRVDTTDAFPVSNFQLDLAGVNHDMGAATHMWRPEINYWIKTYQTPWVSQTATGGLKESCKSTRKAALTSWNLLHVFRKYARIISMIFSTHFVISIPTLSENILNVTFPRCKISVPIIWKENGEDSPHRFFSLCRIRSSWLSEITGNGHWGSFQALPRISRVYFAIKTASNFPAL